MQLSETVIQAVWEKARGRRDRDSDLWRQDQCGAWLQRDHYNSAESEFGWKIENVVAGGADEPDNLQPFHRDNSYDIANGRPQCRVTADRKGFAPEQYVDHPRNMSA
jgi:hypothetical protein